MADMREYKLEDVKSDIRDSFSGLMLKNWPEEIVIGAEGEDELSVRGKKLSYLSQALDTISLDKLFRIRTGSTSVSFDDEARKEEEQEDRNIEVIWKRFDVFARKFLKDKYDSDDSFIAKFVFFSELPYLSYKNNKQYQ